MRPNDLKCKTSNENLMPTFNPMGTHINPACNMPVRRHLEPVLIAKIYNQPIVEEIPLSGMSLTLENTSTILSACTEVRPICDNFCP